MDTSFGNDSDGSDFFSPTVRRPVSSSSSRTPEPLPPSHDTSWIGARLSPIHSLDDEDDDDEEESFQDMKGALQYPASSRRTDGVWSAVGQHTTHEQTRLLLPPLAEEPHTSTSFHPRYTSTAAASSTTAAHRNGNSTALCRYCVPPAPQGFGLYLCSLALFQFKAAVVYSFLYPSTNIHQYEWWRLLLTWIWQPSSLTSLQRVGGLLLSGRSVETYWRLVTSWCLPCTLVEWFLVWSAWSWTSRRLSHKQPLHNERAGVLLSNAQLAVLYILCASTGQLWMLAWDHAPTNSTTVVGCLSWGTGGVLCCLGMLQPHRRLPYFGWAILLVLWVCLSRYLAPQQQDSYLYYSSVWGILGACYFGWAVGASGVLGTRNAPTTRTDHAAKLQEWRSATAAIFMWVLPVLWIAFSNGEV